MILCGSTPGIMDIVTGNGHGDPGSKLAKSAGAVEYTDCFPAEG